MVGGGGDDVQKIAWKLHRQFGHPTPDRLIKLIRDAGIVKTALEKAVKKVSESCVTCCKFKKNKPRPVVSLPMAGKCNETVAMDLKSWGRYYFLVMVDMATRYCNAVVIKDKMARTIIKGFVLNWIALFGAPQKILTDNGCEFNNADMRALGEAYNIKIMTTAAESPWSNGVCERQNAVIGQIIQKVTEDCQCDVEVALAWTISARNALTNFAGFSPNQLVFGSNPNLPNVYINNPPALETSSSEIVRKNLNAMHLSRQAFLKTESGERLARALKHNIRLSDSMEVQCGDEVFYKRNDSTEWRGPGIVIGRDGKQILVRHGGVYVRVHVCRLTKAPEPIEQCMEHTDPKENKEQSEIGGLQKAAVTQETFPTDDDDDGGDDQAGEDRELGDMSGDGASREERAENVQQRPLNSNSTPTVRIGQRIKGTLSRSGELLSGKIVSRAGKSTGKYRHCYNVEKDSDGNITWLDLDKDFDDWEVVDEDTELLVLFNSECVLYAKEKEIDNWRNNDVFDEVDDVGQTTMSVRWVVTEKMKEGKSVVKARLVARGFEEETEKLRKDSPTCSKEAVRLALSVASTNKWSYHSLDVKAAYLQGHKIERIIHLRPPPEFDNGKLWKLKKTVYGLCDAARHWYLRVKEELISLGVRFSNLAPALFSWFNNGRLEGIICVYVDDFLWAGTPEFEQCVIMKLCDKFIIGSAESRSFRYLGLNVMCDDDGNITLDQIQYASALTLLALSRSRAIMKESVLSESEKREYRALVGQLNWIATHTRPDISFDVCELSVNTNKATVSDLLRLNKVISRVKNDHMKLCIPKMGSLSGCHLEGFSDASFANLTGNGSQGGMVIFLRSGDERCPIFWQSRKIKRVVKSTLSAEAMALLECAETAVYLASILREVTGCGSLKVKCFVDNKSLVEAIYSCRCVEDKRLRIDIAVLQDMIGHREIDEVVWLESSLQLADCLTKRGASTDRLRAAVSRDRVLA